MDIKINNITQPQQAPAPEQVQEAGGDFKFVLTSKLEDTNLAERLNLMLQDIVQQGDRITGGSASVIDVACDDNGIRLYLLCQTQKTLHPGCLIPVFQQGDTVDTLSKVQICYVQKFHSTLTFLSFADCFPHYSMILSVRKYHCRDFSLSHLRQWPFRIIIVP